MTRPVNTKSKRSAIGRCALIAATLLLVACGGVGAWVLRGMLFSSDAVVATDDLATMGLTQPVSIVTPEIDPDTELYGAPIEAPPCVLSGKDAVALNLEILESGALKMAKTPFYTATFFKQERVDGHLYDAQVTRLKFRQEPFSVYMKWQVGHKGRELLYVDGDNNGKMLIRVGGWKGRMLPALKLDPTGSLAMKQSRYPVTNLGVGRLTSILINSRREDLKHETGYRATITDSEMCSERPCYYFTLEYENPALSSIYRKTVQYIDKESMLPIYIKNYTWPDQVSEIDAADLDAATMIEFYTYTNIDFEPNLAEVDFDSSNKEYGFTR